MRNVRWRASLVVLVASLAGVGACDRSGVEALNLAQAGDNMVKTDLDGAISQYERATKLDPSNPLLFHKLAAAYEKKEAWDKVAAAMATATRLRPKNATYWFKRGKALAMQAEKGPTPWAEAREPLEKCVSADPNYDDCYFYLAEVNLHLDEEQRALENYTKAIQHDPQELTYYAPLADLYLNLGYYDQAAAVLKEGQGQAQAAPGKVGVFGLHERMAAVHQAKGDANAMVSELEKARRADAEQQHPEVLFSLGSAYAVQKPPNRQQALQLLKTFQSLGCKGAKAQTLKPQCEQAQALVADLQKS
jgi:tetratricopeptide (TPR) repeat protein